MQVRESAAVTTACSNLFSLASCLNEKEKVSRSWGKDIETTLKKTKTKTLQIQEDLHTNSKHLPAMEKMCFLPNLYTAFPLIPSKNYTLICLHHMISCQF